MRQELSKEVPRFYQAIEVRSLFIDIQANKKIIPQLKPLHGIFQKAYSGQDYHQNEYRDLFFEIHSAMYGMLGVQSLSKENRRLIKEDKD